MVSFISRFLLGILIALPAFFNAQNFSITFNTPDQLVVCDADTLQINVSNNTTEPLSEVQLVLNLPQGLVYQPASVTNAAELNIANPAQPTFALNNTLLPGIPVAITVILQAECEAVPPINNGQLFRVQANVQKPNFFSTATSQAFVVETPLIVITDVLNDSVGGQLGDMFFRTILVRNTRLGPIRHLYLRDEHQGKISIEVANATSQTSGPTSYYAYFTGDDFAAYGDGDTLLEFGETAAIQQKITITDCGFPPAISNSRIYAGWSCLPDSNICQTDSARAKVVIEKMDSLPELTFKTEYGLPWDYCGNLRSTFTVKVVNKGKADAENVLFQFSSANNKVLAFDPASIRLLQNGTEVPLPLNSFNGATDFTCRPNLAATFAFTLDNVPEMDSFDILIDGYFCRQFGCSQPTPGLIGNVFYKRECPPPPQDFVSTSFQILPEKRDSLYAEFRYKITECINDGDDYELGVRLTSHRLLRDTGYAWVALDLPWGLFWDDQCNMELPGGINPVFTLLDTLVINGEDTITRVIVAYPLPLTDTMAVIPLCVTNVCLPNGEFILVNASFTPETSTIDVPVPFCGFCGYDIRMRSGVANSLDFVGEDCAPHSCDREELATSCECPLVNEGDFFPDINPGCLELATTHAGQRINYGFRDDNNDRIAESLDEPDLTKIRLDRFMPGDTLEMVLKSHVLCADNGTNGVAYQIFLETLRSDIPYAGANDEFSIGPSFDFDARGWMANDSLFKMLQPFMDIYDASTQQVYTVPANKFLLANELFVQISAVNTAPPSILDEVAALSHIIYVNTDNLVAQNLLPQGFRIETGDSIVLRLLYHLDFNFAPYSPVNRPPLINFELGYSDTQEYEGFLNYQRFDTLMFQYSGYRDSLGEHLFGIRPCNNSTEIRSLYFESRLARANLFPYEVRPIASILDYRMAPPLPGQLPLEARINYVNLQEAVPFSQNLTMPFSTVDSLVKLDFTPVYSTVMDEGYNLSVSVTWPPLCEFKSPTPGFQFMNIHYPEGMPMADTGIIAVLPPIAYFSNRAIDTILAPNAPLEFATKNVNIEVQLNNLALAAAPNYFIELVSVDGGLSNFNLFRMPQNTPYPFQNGAFRLGNLPGGPSGARTLRIEAVNNSCVPQKLRIRYGWDCDPNTYPGAVPCEIDSLDIFITPLLPELELDLVEIPDTLPLCDTSDYLVIDVFNADLGYAYSPYLSVQLPEGIQIIPGTAQISYPEGTPFTPVADPQIVGPFQYRWALDSVVPVVAANGLPGVNLQPQNTIRVRFKVQTICGAVSAGQMIVGTGALKVCGEPSNILNKASDPLIIEGFSPTYNVNIGVNASGPASIGCNETAEITISAQINGVPAPGDSIYVILPPGITYVPGSYVPLQNAPSAQPDIDGNIIRISIPPSTPVNANILFRISVQSSSMPLCEGALVQVQSRQQKAAFCETLGEDCAIYVATGNAQLLFLGEPNSLVLQNISAAITGSGQALFSGEVVNTGTAPADLLTIAIYHDLDGNGWLSPGDTQVILSPVITGVVAPGATFPFTFISGFPAQAWCDLIAVLPADVYCLCSQAAVPVSTGDFPDSTLTACLGQPLQLGFGAIQGVTFVWQPDTGLSCSNCPEPEFTATNTGIQTISMTVTLAPGCIRDAIWTLETDSLPVITSLAYVICAGDTVVLSTGAAESWQWSGPGINNPSLPVQTVVPQSSASYQVIVTDENACSVSATIEVAVNDSILVDLGTIRTCAGVPVSILGNFTDNPGLYCVPFTRFNGCDSTICQRLELVPETASEAFRCPDQPVVLFGDSLWTAGRYCFQFPSSAGCDSTHCVMVMDLPSLPVYDADTLLIIAGDSVQLMAPSGYEQYQWSPTEGLSCSTCPNPVAMPSDSTVYTVTLTNKDGCTAVAVYRTFYFPPCNPVSVRMPDAFSPNGDGLHETFEPVPSESLEVATRLRIYTRWGEKVYEGAGTGISWDGKVNGQPTPTDVYIWLLDVDCSGQSYVRRGEVTLFR